MGSLKLTMSLIVFLVGAISSIAGVPTAQDISEGNNATGAVHSRHKRAIILYPLGLAALQLINAVGGIAIKVKGLTASGCCHAVMNGLCADGTQGSPFCGYQQCNIFGCDCGACRQGWFVTVHEDFGFKGEEIGIVGGSSCRNLGTRHCFTVPIVNPSYPSNVNKCINPSDWISSVNTHGNCVKVYEHDNCQGASMTIAPGQGCHSNLGNCQMWGGGPSWNDQISSIGPC